MTRPVLLGLDGRSGAGKTTLAATVVGALTEAGHDVGLFHLEDVYTGWHGLAGGLEIYVRDVLTPLGKGREATWTPWDWERDAPAATPRTTAPRAVVLCEGVGAAIPAARALLDTALTLRADAALRHRRAMARDGATYEPWWDVWARQEDALPATEPREQDLILAADDPERAARAIEWALTAARRTVARRCPASASGAGAPPTARR